MIKLVARAPGLSDAFNSLLKDHRESCAVFFTEAVPISDGPTGFRLLVREIEFPPSSAYLRRDEISAVLSPGYLLTASNHARLEGLGLVLVHTHPSAVGVPQFSPIDDRGEAALRDYLRTRLPHAPHLTLVVGPDGCRSRVLGENQENQVLQVGSTIDFLFSPDVRLSSQNAHDRQVRAFGADGQANVGNLRVGIVGLGGTGSIVAQQLAHLGVRRFTLVDYDSVEESNLNRLVGARTADIGQNKVMVARREIMAINPASEVTSIAGDVVNEDVARRLLSCDFIFLCTDSHASRAVVGQLSYQYLIPCIDMGVSITVKDHAIAHVTGRVQMLTPGLACLTCTGALDANAIRQELMTPEQRRADPYFVGHHEPQPAVISLNGAMASLAVTMFLGAVTPIPAGPRLQIYDGIRGTVRPAVKTPESNCIVCSELGALGRGDRWQLPTRRSSHS